MTTTAEQKQKLYEDKRYELIKQVEEGGHENPEVYIDGAGIPTMGVGFNLKLEKNVTAILEHGFGITDNMGLVIALSAEASLIESAFDDAVTAYKAANSKPSDVSDTQWNNTVKNSVVASLNDSIDNKINPQLRLDKILNDAGYPGQFIIPPSDDGAVTAAEKIRKTFDILIKSYEIPLDSIIATSTLVSEYSDEHLALISLQYNGVLGPKLKTALADGSRFKAWYEIRYQSNDGLVRGIGKRRYLEAELFGLFSSDAPQNTEAKTVIDAFLEESHFTKISSDELELGKVKDGVNVAQMANRDYGSLSFVGHIPNFGEIFKPITSYLLERFNPDGEDITDLASTINGEVILGILNAQGEISSSVMGDAAKDKNDLLIAVEEDKISTLVGGFGDDILIGNKQGDTLKGGDGHDHLIGNGGADTLIGGKGNDTYYVDLQDTIIEKAGEGDADTIIASMDYALTAGQHEHIEQIRLDTSNGGSGLLLSGNELDNILIGNQLDNILLGGGGEDTLYGGAGDDILEAGEEDVYGEGDLNILQGGADNDTLIGGDGIDLLYGGTGDDTLYVGRGGIHIFTPTSGVRLGTEYMNGGEDFDTYYVGGASNSVIIDDSDGQGEIYVKADEIGDNTYKLKGGGFWGEQTTDKGLEADGYTEILIDGRSNNYTLAYELDGSQTLIAYGFNIYNFYNGMLGIKLEGGRVDTGNNVVDDVLDKIAYDEAFDPADIERIKSVIKNAYEQSPIMRNILRDFAVVGDNAININFSEDNFYSSAGAREILEDANATGDTAGLYIDLNWLENKTYISTNGTAVEDTLETALIHELVHLMTGLQDTSNPGEKGDTVVFANSIYEELGLAEQASYLAYDSTGQTHVTNFEYTQGQAIDRAFTLWSENPSANDFDSSIGGDLDDLIIGNERENTLKSGEGNDFLYGGAGNDFLSAGEGNDLLNGGAGSDFLSAGAGNDLLNGGTGNDELFAVEGNNVLNGGAGNDVLFAGEGNDLLNGGTGNDELSGGGGDNIFIYSYGDGSDVYKENSSGVDTIKFTDIASTDVKLNKEYGSLIFSFAGNTDQISFYEHFYADYSMDFFEFSDGVIWDVNDINTKLTTGTNFDDNLYGDNSNNELTGLGGNDELYGEDGNDLLNGGTGNDLLFGGLGDDVYLFNIGSGNDKIIDVEGENSIQFGAGITASDLHIVYSSYEVIISLISDNPQADDQILINKTYSNNPIDKLVFFNGDTILWDPTKKMYDSEEIVAEFIDDDFDNIIYAEPDEINMLYGTDDNDLFIGPASYHTTYHINASAGHDIIEGNQSNFYDHYLNGEWSKVDGRGFLILHDIADDQILAVRDGDDLVLNISGGEAQSIRIIDQFIGFGLHGIFVEKPNINGANESVSYFQYMHPEYSDSDWEGQINYYREFDDLFGPRVFGSRIQGTYLDDTLEGTDGDDIIDGGKGDDTLNGGKGDDTYNYEDGDGNDTITDDKGVNKIKFGEGITIDGVTVTATGGGNYIVDVPNGENINIQGNPDNITVYSFRFNDGTIWNASDVWANTVVAGTDGDDTMDYKNLSSGTTYDMGKGDDTIYGGTGDDTYLFNVGDGQDVFSDSQGTDKINFGAGITADNLRITHDDTESHWIVELLDNNSDLTGDRITVENAYTGFSDTVNNRFEELGEGLQNSFMIERFEFSDGSFMSLAEIQLAAETLYTKLDPEVITEIEGTNGDDELVGDKNINIISAYDGNDTLTGGLGNDILIGGKGDDTYLYNLGDGFDNIDDDSGSDVLRFGVGITADNISVSANDTDMLITLSDGQVITIANWYQPGNWYQSGSSRLEQFEFVDGTVWAVTDILANMVVVGADGGGTVNNANLVSGTTYEMGLGDDSVYGGKGDDVYLYNLGDGFDNIDDYSGADTLRFGAGITADNISVSANDTDMLITLSDGQVITIANWYQLGDWFQPASSRLEQFEFVDGTVWKAADILENMIVVGTDGDSTVDNQYLASGTTYDMGLGDDTVYGGLGDDTYLYNLGDGNDHISDFSGTDTLRFGAGITADNISVSVNFIDMLITLPDDQVITIANWYQLGSTRVEQFEFSDGTVWNTVDIISNISIETAFTLTSEYSPLDANLNLLIQSYSSFDDASDESGLALSKEGNAIILPVLESTL